MFVKSYPRKTATFAQLLKYISRSPTTSQTILHNVLSVEDRPNMILSEFLDNARHLKKRKNGNILYHDILSFSPHDRPHLTHGVLHDLTHQYIQLRCPDSLVYAKPHFDTNHPHVHLLISANGVGNSRPHRLSRSEFHEIKQQIEQYQQQYYPELEHSLAQSHERELPKRRKESELHRRLASTGTRSKKEQVYRLVAVVLDAASTIDQFTSQLRLTGFDLYRRGSTMGIIDLNSGRKYRLKTLGLLEQYEALALLQERTPELEDRLADLQRLPSHHPTPSRSRL